MRNLKYTAALAVAALFAAACSNDPAEEAVNPLPPSSDLPIRWDVKDVAAPAGGTRVMVGETSGTNSRPTDPADPDFFITLPEVCTVPDNDPNKEKGFAIGLFGDYSYEENGKAVTVKDFYRGARLVYLPDAKEKDPTLPSGWDTDVAMKYWHPGAKYIFRAYYPQRLYNYTVSTSNATTFALVYPSRKLQYDLLLGVTPVDTNAEGWSGRDAVEIKMDHALAALRFQFRLNFEDADFLTSVYLLNDEECHFFTQGTVVYGDEKDLHSIQWLLDYNPPADEVLYKWVPPLKYWYGVDTDNDGVIETEEELYTDLMLKKWGIGLSPDDDPSSVIGNPKDNPILMISENGNVSPHAGGSSTPGGENTASGDANDIPYTGKYAQAYFGMEDYYDVTTDPHQWKNKPEEEVAVEGTLFCRNSGWLLIPPQESYGKLTLCFTTKRGVDAVYKVTLPTITGTKIDEKGELITDGSDGGTDAWVGGMRYTYLVTLSQSDLDIAVSVKPWNERKHSTEIVF